ncbi:hypothetical protein HAX54_044912 [Datura stramonium]|uniref:Uncharacterized protein n=1 Tax=Datura stramonium TaxID=4076 RepID=A0ABS8SPX3_DATST|nr:hypothetical protein [Datura stramonium]
MTIGSGTKLDKLNASAKGLDSKSNVFAFVSSFDEGVKSEIGVVDGSDEVLVVCSTDILVQIHRSSEVAEVMKDCLRLASKSLAHEPDVFTVADGGGEEELVKFVSGVCVFYRRNNFPAHLRRVHRQLCFSVI